MDMRKREDMNWKNVPLTEMIKNAGGTNLGGIGGN